MPERLVIAAGGPTAGRLVAAVAELVTEADGAPRGGRMIEVDVVTWTAPLADPAVADAPSNVRLALGAAVADRCVRRPCVSSSSA